MENKSIKSLMQGSITLLVLFNIFNFLNLIFQIFVAHRMSIAAYGIFTALFSMIYVFGIFSESIQLSVSKKVATTKQKSRISGIYHSAMKSSLITASLVFIAYIALLISANFAFDIDLPLILLSGISAFFALSSPVVRGVLQGQKRFVDLGINTVVEGISKLALGVLMIALGWEIYGVLGAVVAAMAIALAYGIFIQIPSISRSGRRQEDHHPAKELIFGAFTPEVFTIISCIMLFFLLDSFLARAVLSPVLAGYYAIASTVAKMAFIGTQPISKAMLSHVASARSEADAKRMYSRSLILLISILLAGFLFVFFFSDLIVLLFSGEGKSSSASILPIVFVAQALISLANLALFYKVARDKTKGVYLLPLLVVLLVAILLAAPASLIGFSLSYLAATIIFLTASMLILR